MKTEKINKICSRCGKLHPIGFKCYANSKNYYQHDPKIQKFRNSQSWRNKAEEIKERDHYLCQYCMSKNIFNYNNLSTHHIISLADDFSKRLDNSNLITLCEQHHRMAEQGKITKAELIEIIERQ